MTAGEFGKWTPIGAVQTASGYDVAWKNTGTGQYTVWSTDRNGNYKVSLTGGAVSATSYALELLEPVFRQDLNRDGVVGLYARPGTSLHIHQALAGTSGSATIGKGATLELTAADTAAVTFASSTGTLRLDHSSTFHGEIFKFAGNGSLSGSDHIDLRDIKYSSVHDSYSNGVLTLTDGRGDTANLNFNGSYALSNFALVSDGSGGTIVYDPPVASSNARTANTPRSAIISNGATLETAAHIGSVTLTGAKGTLTLDDDPASTGQAFNFTRAVSGAQSVIDLPLIGFDAQTTLGYLPNGNLMGPSLNDRLSSANIALLGNYMASSFAVASDSHGATVIAEAAIPKGQSLLSNPHHA